MSLMRLYDLIDEAMNSEDEIDRTYLLEAVQKDLLLLHEGEPIQHVQDLIDNPIS